MKRLLEELRSGLLDPQAGALTDTVEWWSLPSLGVEDPFPVAVLGEGEPLLLLHGFDSSFLEYRRLAPLLSGRFQLIIPDLFGFGFSPRPLTANYGTEPVMLHLEALLNKLPSARPVSVIGASMVVCPIGCDHSCCLPPLDCRVDACRCRPYSIVLALGF